MPTPPFRVLQNLLNLAEPSEPSEPREPEVYFFIQVSSTTLNV